MAAVAGFAISVPIPDNDSIDLILHKKSPHEEDEEDNLIGAPQVAIQVKCTAREVIRNNALHFPLKIKNYNDLRKQKVLVPRILLVHCIPADMGDWLRHSEDDMLLRRCSYWVSLRGKPAVPNGTQVMVQVPQVNQFTPEAVSAIMERIERGEPL